jgi:alpha-beta hydrolase superfamily lysophospholipase
MDGESEPTAVAMIIHGLNCKPSRMMGIADMLVAQGVECLNVSLRGHGDDASSGSDPRTADSLRLEAFKSVTRRIWLSEARAAYALARARADDRGVPLVLVGFSLGAVVGSEIECEPASEVAFDGMIFFAPAFAIHWYTRALHCLALFPRLTLRSRSPVDYAANRGTPMAAYNALFESIAALRKCRHRQLATAALVFIDPKDELVSYRGMRAICQGPEAQRWKMVRIRKALQKGRRDYHHLIIDEPSLGSERWSDVVRHVKEFLASLRRS